MIIILSFLLFFFPEASQANNLSCRSLFSVKSVSAKMTNHKEQEWPVKKIQFWEQLLIQMPLQGNLDGIPESYLKKKIHFEEMTQKEHHYPETSLRLSLLETVADGLPNFRSDTYPEKINFYKNPHHGFGDTTLVRENYRFLHVTRPQIAQTIVASQPKFSPGLEAVQTKPGSGMYEHSPLGQFFYSAFFTSMSRLYTEPLGQRIYSKDKGAYQTKWSKSDPLAPVLIEVFVKPSSRVLDLRKGFYIYGQELKTTPGYDVYYGWYLNLSVKSLENFILSRISPHLLKEFPLKDNMDLWRAPQTFAHLIGADIVYYEAGLRGGNKVQELNIINPAAITHSKIIESPMETPYLDFRY